MKKTVLAKAKRAVPSGVKRWCREAAWKNLNLAWLLKSGLKISVRSYSDWVIYNEIFVNGEYDSPILKVLGSKPSDRNLHIVDIGANVGFFTLRVIDLARLHDFDGSRYDITLIEGNPVTVERLRANLAQQNLQGTTVKVISGLVGERAGSAVITNFEICGNNTIVGAQKTSGMAVNFVNLDELLTPTSDIDLLKCDIEGAEQVFLENYSNLIRRVKAAVFEMHHDKCDVARCLTLLREAGLVNCETLSSSEHLSVCYLWR